MNKERSYFVGGVNGVGKSSFLREVRAQDSQFEVFSAAAELMKWLGLEAGDYDSLRSLPEEHKIAEFNKLMQHALSNLPKKQTLLVDAHYFNYNKGEPVDTTGSWMAGLDAFVVIDASPQVILKRIQKSDKSRNLFPEGLAEEEKLAMLVNYTSVTLVKAREVADKYNIPLITIDNKEGELSRSVLEFLEAHQRISEDNSNVK